MAIEKQTNLNETSSEAPTSAGSGMRDSIKAAIAEERRKLEESLAAEEVSADEEPDKARDSGGDGEDGVDASATSEGEDGQDDNLDDSAEHSDAEEAEETEDSEDKSATTDRPPPQSWNKNSKNLWDTLPSEIQDQVYKREEDTERGVTQLKSRYHEIDEAVNPYRGLLQQVGKTPGQAITQLFSWHQALASPNKVEAFKALARNYGIDPEEIASGAKASPQESPEETIKERIHPEIVGRLQANEQRQAMLENALAMERQARTERQQAEANEAVSRWAQDKPHFEAVRDIMGRMIQLDLNLLDQGQEPINGFVVNGQVDMDAAYNAAIWEHPRTRDLLIRAQTSAAQREIQLKAARDAKASKAAAAAAKKAGASLRAGAPLSGAMNGATAPQAAPNESVRDSLRRALSEARGR